MSTNKRLRKIKENDRVTVIDQETGLSAEGESYEEALEELVITQRKFGQLADTLQELQEFTVALENFRETITAIEEGVTATVSDFGELGDALSEIEMPDEDKQVAATFITDIEETHDRFAEENVEKEVVGEAIEWARSQ